jgi:hypothetical protein
VVDCGPTHLRLLVPPGALKKGTNNLRMALDPYALVSVDIAGGARPPQ